MHENALISFKIANVIGHAGALPFSRLTSQLGYNCAEAATPFMPYLLIIQCGRQRPPNTVTGL